MRLTMPRPIPLLFLLALFASNRLVAQETIGLQITALTSAERDSVVSLTQASGDLQLVYACVPAGVLVLATDTPSGTREVLRSRAVAALAPVVQAGRIDPIELTLHAAETACENARGQ